MTPSYIQLRCKNCKHFSVWFHDIKNKNMNEVLFGDSKEYKELTNELNKYFEDYPSETSSHEIKNISEKLISLRIFRQVMGSHLLEDH